MKIKPIKQRDDSACGPTSIQMILNYFKVPYTFKEIAKVSGYEKKGGLYNKDLVVAGALLHDIKKINSEDHVIEGYGLVKSLGYPEVANLIKKHGLYHLEEEEFTPKTWEEKIVFYADKRVKGSKIVNVDERFEYIKQRYKKDNVEKEVEFTKKIEYELLGDEKI